MKIKRATIEQMPKVAEIVSSSASWYQPFVTEKDMAEHTVGKEWIDKNFKKRDFYLGVDKEGNEVGTISMQFFGEETYLGYIYLDTKFVGKGYGHALMSFAEEVSKERGQDSLILIAHPEATWATKAYKKFGFKKIKENKEEILKYKDGILKTYYEDGFHLYKYKL